MRFLQKSLEIAAALWSPRGNNLEMRCFHVSVVFYKNRILAIGRNKAKSHPLNIRNIPLSKHGNTYYLNIKKTCSELSACQILKNKTNILTKNCILVNVRIDQNGNIRNSRPCPSCSNLLNYFQHRR